MPGPFGLRSVAEPREGYAGLPAIDRLRPVWTLG